MSINNIVGPPVEGDDFFGRKNLVELAWDYLTKSNNLVFAAPRRVGKTSVGKKLVQIAQKEGWRAFEVNLEEVKSEEGFIRLLLETMESQNWWSKLIRKSKSNVNKVLERIKTKVGYEGAEVSVEWKKVKDDVFEDFKKVFDHSTDTLIMIDEMTVLLSILVNKNEDEGVQNAEFILNWLRNLRQETDSKIRWIFCSSVGIANFCNIHSLSYTLNDVADFEIGAYDRQVAFDLLRKLSTADGQQFPDEIIDYILDHKVTWHLPYFLQLIYFNIHKNMALEDVELTKQEVDRAFIQLASQNQLDTWDERLKQYNYLEKTARRILNHTCKTNNGATRNKLIEIVYPLHQEDIDETNLALSRTLKMLINDGYLQINENAKYIFRSSVIKAYWHNKFVV